MVYKLHSVSVPLDQLLNPRLTAQQKLVWLYLQLDQNHVDEKLLYSPTHVERRIGISRPTIRKAFERLKQHSPQSLPPRLQRLAKHTVQVSLELVTDKSLPAMARVIYPILVALSKWKDRFNSYRAIAQVLKLQARTVRRAVLELAKAGWLHVKQPTRRSPLSLTFHNPFQARRNADVLRAEQRLNKSEYKGETLALLWCDTLVDSDRYRDDHFPEAFVNPETGELLQADRYYLDYDVAIEFNGPQHYGATELFTQEQAQAQQARDKTKQDICKLLDIPLIIVHSEDLTLKRMQELLGKVLPLRKIDPREPMIRYLERVSLRYIKATARRPEDSPSSKR